MASIISKLWPLLSMTMNYKIIVSVNNVCSFFLTTFPIDILRNGKIKYYSEAGRLIRKASSTHNKKNNTDRLQIKAISLLLMMARE